MPQRQPCIEVVLFHFKIKKKETRTCQKLRRNFARANLNSKFQGALSKLTINSDWKIRLFRSVETRPKCSIAGPIFSKYCTGHCPEWFRTWVFAVFAFFSRVINLLLTKLARDRTGRLSALGLFSTELAALGPYCPDLGPIFSQYGPRAWFTRYTYRITAIQWISVNKTNHAIRWTVTFF